MDVSSPRPSQRRPAAVAQREAPSRSMQPTYKDYHSDESEVEFRRHRDIPGASERSHLSDLGATQTVNFKQDEESRYSSHIAAKMSSADSASMFNDAKSISASSKYSKDSGYHSGPDAIQPEIVSRPSLPPIPAFIHQPTIRNDCEDIRLQVAIAPPPSPQLSGNALPRIVEINPAEGGMADIVVSDTGRGRGENRYSLSLRRPLQRSGSLSGRQSRERRKEKVEGCTDPNCMNCGPGAPSRHPQQNTTSTRRSAVVQPAQTAGRRSSSKERMRPRPASYRNPPPPNYWVSSIPPHRQYAYPQQYPSPSQEHGPPPSKSAYMNCYSPYSTRYPGLNGWPPDQIAPMQTSPAYHMARPPTQHMMPTPPYEYFSPPKSRMPSPTRARRPARTVHPSPQMPSARYPPLVTISDRPQSSDSSESESSDNEERDLALIRPPKRRPSLCQPSATTIRQNPIPMSQSIPSLTVRTRKGRSSEDSRYKSGSQHEQRDKLPDRHHSRRSSMSQTELGGLDQFLVDTRKQMAYEREETDRSDREEQQSRRLSITQLDDSAKKLERLLAQRRRDRGREEEAKEKRERERTEREERRNLERAERERRQKEKAAAAAAIRNFVENPQYQIPRSGDARLPKPSTPLRTYPVKEPQLPSKQSQKRSTAPLSPTTIVDTNLQDMLGTNARSESPKRAIVSVEPQQSLSSLDKTREDIRKTFEPLRHLQPNPISPILPPQTDNILADDRPLEVQHVQADIYEYDVSLRVESITSSPKPSPITLSLSTLSSDPTAGFEHDSGGLGTSHPNKLAKRSKDVEKLANISQPERMERVELPSFPSNTSTEIMNCTTRDDAHSDQAMVGPTKELVLLSKPSKSDMSEISSVVDLLPTSHKAITRLERSGDSSAGDAEEEDHNFVEMDGESDEASEEGEVSVRSALDTAMNVVKGLLLQELLDYALPEATDALGGSGSSSSLSHAGSAGSSASSRLSSCISNSQTPQRRKRTRGNGRDPDDGDGSGSDDENRPKKNKKGSPDRLPHRRLKCPFYQRQPEKYTKAACRGEGFADMAKLKDHIKRVHTQPLRCSRCWLEMKSDDAYSEHIQQEDICKKKPEPQEDRIRPQMLKRLNFKKAPYANARNVEEKWNMLFSVLFPNDTNIPSPYEQQGMSPRLERALSEALEEELTRELAPILEPIMLHIKELIPAIIESCRLKLMHASPSSDDETVFTPSAVSSGTGSSDSEPGSSEKQAKHQSSPTASQFSGSSFEVVPIPEVLSSKAQGKRLQRPAPSTGDMSVESRQKAPSSGSSTDFSIFYPDAPSDMPNLHGSNIDDSLDMGDDGGLFALPGGFPSNGTPPAAEGSSTFSANTRGITSGPYDLVEGLAQQSNEYLPGSQLSSWPSPGPAWDSGGGAHGQPRGEHPGGTIPREQEPPPEWDLMMNDFDFSHFSNR